jgi:hypothetical protein
LAAVSAVAEWAAAVVSAREALSERRHIRKYISARCMFSQFSTR